jgi:hypothetical protein
LGFTFRKNPRNLNSPRLVFKFVHDLTPDQANKRHPNEPEIRCFDHAKVVIDKTTPIHPPCRSQKAAGPNTGYLLAKANNALSPVINATVRASAWAARHLPVPIGDMGVQHHPHDAAR